MGSSLRRCFLRAGVKWLGNPEQSHACVVSHRGRVIRVLLLHVARDYSLRAAVVRAKFANWADISDVALLKRPRDSKGWLRLLCIQLLQENVEWHVAEGVGRKIHIVDGTIVREAGKSLAHLGHVPKHDRRSPKGSKINTLASGTSLRIICAASIPFIRGMETSIIMRSGFNTLAFSIASRPFRPFPTDHPSVGGGYERSEPLSHTELIVDDEDAIQRLKGWTRKLYWQKFEPGALIAMSTIPTAGLCSRGFTVLPRTAYLWCPLFLASCRALARTITHWKV
jgi:hypothetical protein